jgi:hypothetical protein
MSKFDFKGKKERKKRGTVHPNGVISTAILILRIARLRLRLRLRKTPGTFNLASFFFSSTLASTSTSLKLVH